MARNRSEIVDTDRGYRKVTGRLLGMGNLGVTVGVQEGTDEDILTRAVVNEFGSEDGRVPERSFLRSTLDERQRKYGELLGQAIEAVLDGVPESEAFRQLGDVVVRDVQEKIRSGVLPENAPSTVAQKGHGRTLIESGDLHDAIEAKVGSLR